MASLQRTPRAAREGGRDGRDVNRAGRPAAAPPAAPAEHDEKGANAATGASHPSGASGGGASAGAGRHHHHQARGSAAALGASGASGASGSESHGGRGEPPGGLPETPALDLDRVIHERLRLGIVSALAVNHQLSFNDLKQLLRTTDGNLSVHARKLEEAGYVRCDKFFVGRLPKTEYRLTAAGRRALERYLDHMEAIIHATRFPLEGEA
ncbi:MAG TPA: transcriptional regulator [Thermoanaerobaculia bacterium]|nr:transcriptional regulator [Thermoanaerobaculia bacterium]